MAGSRTRFDSSRTSIAMRRLQGREGEERGAEEERCAGAQRPRAGHISSYTSCEVRPIEMLAAPRNRITTTKVAHSEPKCYRRGREYFRPCWAGMSTGFMRIVENGGVGSLAPMRMSELFLRTLRDD